MPKIIKNAAFLKKAAVQVGLPSKQGFTPSYLPPKPSIPEEAVECSQKIDPVQVAKEKAEAILAEAEASAAALKRDAVIRGYNDGQAEGFRAAQEQCQE
ncbi:MAG: hypothetical protein ACOX87_08065, partial [Chloroflexota bacterium]